MKPAAVVVVLSLGILSGGAPARADSPWQPAEPLPLPSVFVETAEPGHWSAPWPARPPLVAEGADLWYDYRGACIEHDLYRPRFLARSGEERHRRPLLSAVGNWLDGLFAWMPPHRYENGQFCHAAGPTAEDTGFAPGPALPGNSRAPQPAPFLEPVPLRDINPQPSVQAAPSPPVPVQVVPAEPTPPPPAAHPPTNEIPKLSAPRGPIVELAPQPAIPADEPPSTIVVPRNRVPRTGDPLPRSAPRNAIPR